MSHPSGNKILIWDDAPCLATSGKPPPVRGCRRADPVAVRRLARQYFKQYPDRHYVFLNGLGSVLMGPPEER